MSGKLLGCLVGLSALALTIPPAQAASPYDRVAYWDAGYAAAWAGAGATTVRDALQKAGYRVIGAADLKTWMTGHIADKLPSVVVFCIDAVPDTVTETETATCTLRRYLEAGGKIVWFSDIPVYYQGLSGSTKNTWADNGSVQVLGFGAASATPRDVNGQVKITAAGTRWGLKTPWTSTRPTLETGTANFEILATDTNGHAAGWVKHYVPGDACRGFVRIDDHSGAPVDIPQLMAVAEYYVTIPTAVAPNPADGATDVPRDAAVSWVAGAYPSVHDVYFGTVAADVSSASRTNPKGVLAGQGQADTTFDPPGVFAYGQTSYWRVDEVNKSADGAISKGAVWSFTAEPYAYPITRVTAIASSSQSNMGPGNTINGSGLTGDLHGTDVATMWTSAGTLPNWVQYQFDKVYKLYDLKVWNYNGTMEPFVGFGAKDVKIEYSTDAATWTTLPNVPQFAQAPGLANYAANTTVNFGGVMAQYVRLTINSNWGGMQTAVGLSEVRFSYVPLQARSPQPATGATGQSVTTTVSWRPGREAGSHKVYFATDQATVTNGRGLTHVVTDHAYDPGPLNYGTTYYWRVDEVNTVATPGDVWSFTTVAYGLVEDFESYTDAANQEIFSTWIDGYTDGKSGSFVGNNPTAGQLAAGTGHFAETTILHSGAQSMPIGYDNTGKFAFSEATRMFDTAQNWTLSGIKSLSLWIRGPANNTGGQLYLKINSVKVPYNGSANDLTKGVWLPWNIDLSTVSGLSKVNSLTIGIEGAGSKGTVYIDDIRLYPLAPQYVVPVDPGQTNLVGYWTLDGDAKDSSGKGNNGTVSGTASWVTGKNNKALQFDGTSTYVDCGSGAGLKLTDAVTIMAWIKPDFTAADRKIAGNQDGTTGGYKMGVYSNNMVEFEIRTAASAATLNRTSAGGTTLQQGAWYHVAGVYSKGQYIRTYVYGNLDRELVTTVLLGSSTGTFKLGREPSAASNYWLGALDDVQVYNRALAQEEILWLSGQTTLVAKPFN